MDVMNRFSEDANSEVKDEGAIDKISSLPDDILSHIISFLPTKYAVSTCILSRRWRWLFRFIRRVDFDSDQFRKDTHGCCDLKRAARDFEVIVSRFLLMLHMSKITSFRADCNMCIDYKMVSDWVTIIASKEVQELDIQFSVPSPCSLTDVLPSSLFSSKTLTTLKLNCQTSVPDIPMTVSLPGLKALHLKNLTFLNAGSVSRLFSGCPALEDLAFKNCIWQVADDVNISAPSLGSLRISSYGSSAKKKIMIEAPNLVNFSYLGKVKVAYCLKNVNALGKVTLHFSRSKFNILRDVVRGFSNVKVLCISGHPLRYLNGGYSHWPTFSNLTKLELCYGACVKWEILPALLASSPRIQTLSFRQGIRDKECAGDVRHPHRVLLPFSSCVTEIEVHEFEGHKDELEVVEYLLKNATLLKKMMFFHSGNEMSVEEQLQLNDKLSELREVFPNCSLELRFRNGVSQNNFD